MKRIENLKYIKEIDALRSKMVKAEAWAKKLPIFANEILENKITGEEGHIRYTNAYKKFYTSWGISRGIYENGTNRSITNNTEKYKGYFWCIYVNTYSMFDLSKEFGLSKLGDLVYYYDSMNTTFYATDDEIEVLMDALNTWYLTAREQVKKDLAEEKIKKLQRELDVLRKG